MSSRAVALSVGFGFVRFFCLRSLGSGGTGSRSGFPVRSIKIVCSRDRLPGLFTQDDVSLVDENVRAPFRASLKATSPCSGDVVTDRDARMLTAWCALSCRTVIRDAEAWRANKGPGRIGHNVGLQAPLRIQCTLRC